MASIVRRKNSKYYYACFRVPIIEEDSGAQKWKTVMRCTKQVDRKKAEKAADDIESATLAEMGAGDEGSRKMLAVLKMATENAARGVLTESLARSYLEEIFLIANGEDLDSYTTRSWFDEWLSRKARSTKPSTFSLYRLACNSFADWIGQKASGRIEQIKPQEVRRWRDELHDAGRAAKTSNQYFKSVAGAFRAAVSEGVLLKSPCDGIEFLPLDDSTKREPFEPREVASMISAAKPDWKLAIRLGYFTGLRLRDVANLRWSDVDLENRAIIIEPMKQARKKAEKKQLLIPLHVSLVEAFAEHPVASSDPDGPVFPKLAGKPSGGNGGLSWQFSQIMDKAGVDPMILKDPIADAAAASKNGGKAVVRKAGRKVSARGFHSLRHTFVSALANSDVSPELRKEIAGHSDDASHNIYTHTDRDRIAGAIDRLERLPKV